MASVPKFYLRNKPSKDGKHQIILKYSFNGQRLEYYCGISIKPDDYNAEYWKGKKKPVKLSAVNGININNRLIDIQADTLSIISDTKGEDLNPAYIREKLDLIYKPKPVEPTKQQELAPEYEISFIKYFEKVIKDSRNGIRLMKKPSSKAGQRYSERAIKNYGVTLSAIKRYVKYYGFTDLKFEYIDEDFYNSFRGFCYNTESKEKATFAGYIKDIKTLMAETGRDNQTTEFIKPTYEADTVALTTQQIDLIANLDLNDTDKYYTNDIGKKISFDTLGRVRDLFLIGSYTGLRFSDFSRLDINTIDGNFIRLKQQKTSDRVTIPIMSKLKPVLAKYKELPTITNQKFNDYIKHVAELAGLTEIRTVSNTKGNKINIEKRPLYKLVSSHCCRRSYATNMFKAGIPPMLIMSATGHKTEQSFLKYIRANNDDKAKLLADVMSKLGL